MIGKLTGTLDSTGDGWLIVDVGGVGYVVYASTRTLGSVGSPGAPATLLIETHVREDHIHLYGFIDAAERDWFRLLSTVQGVGARMALAILSVLPPTQLVQALAAQDKAALTRASGVGPKLAGRIVTELKDKAGRIALGEAARQHMAGVPSGVVPPLEPGGVSEDAVSALVNLGYGRAEAFGAVAHAAQALGGDAPLPDVIRAGLKELAS